MKPRAQRNTGKGKKTQSNPPYPTSQTPSFKDAMLPLYASKF